MGINCNINAGDFFVALAKFPMVAVKTPAIQQPAAK